MVLRFPTKRGRQGWASLILWDAPPNKKLGLPLSFIIMDHILEKVTVIPNLLYAGCIFKTSIMTYLLASLYHASCRKRPPLHPHPVEGEGGLSHPFHWPLVRNHEFLLWIYWNLYLYELRGIDKFCLISLFCNLILIGHL